MCSSSNMELTSEKKKIIEFNSQSKTDDWTVDNFFVKKKLTDTVWLSMDQHSMQYYYTNPQLEPNGQYQHLPKLNPLVFARIDTLVCFQQKVIQNWPP
ncbi:hypothetical protein TNCT_558491 [Trichonephila clavata]|uniref:Uncharacterized protein n=1 Tax=Trichonephila clavata TaxID=2740835 RepID=A0A8X6I052_TRICU|nr:hypothetical protein TNCT_558491 [Trichonephila clavata]